MKLAVVHTAQMLGMILIEPGTVVEVLDKDQISEDNAEEILDIKGNDSYLWVKCKSIDHNRSFTIPTNRVNIMDDPKEVRLYEVLFG